MPCTPEPDANVGTFPGDGGVIRALHARYSAPKRLDETAAVFSEIMAAPDKGIPQALLQNAHCIVIVPDLKTAAFGVGGKCGIRVPVLSK